MLRVKQMLKSALVSVRDDVVVPFGGWGTVGGFRGFLGEGEFLVPEVARCLGVAYEPC